MDERLPCGHQVPLFRAASGGLIAITHPKIDTGYGTIPAIVWCHDGVSCGWVDVSDEQHERIKEYRQYV
jgi:hypothetical protein